jgi:hypothetical protein
MDTLSAMKSLGLELPSPTYIFGAVVFGLLGWAAFRFGRKRGRKLTLWLGVALMLYPYVVTNTVLMYAVGAAMCAGIAWDHSRG